jgi:hypothetical protein
MSLETINIQLRERWPSYLLARFSSSNIFSWESDWKYWLSPVLLNDIVDHKTQTLVYSELRIAVHVNVNGRGQF